jgi:hypothetical protein
MSHLHPASTVPAGPSGYDRKDIGDGPPPFEKKNYFWEIERSTVVSPKNLVPGGFA